MQIDFKILTHNTRLINFDIIIRDSFKQLHKDCILYSMPIDIENNLDCRKLFKNSVIVTLCNRIKTISVTDKKIVYINTNSLYIPQHIRNIVHKIIYQILDNLSISYISNDEEFTVFVNGLLNRDNDRLYLFNEVYNKISSSNIQTTYKKLMNYLKNNGLMFLYNSYFRGSTNKLIVLS